MKYTLLLVSSILILMSCNILNNTKKHTPPYEVEVIRKDKKSHNIKITKDEKNLSTYIFEITNLSDTLIRIYSFNTESNALDIYTPTGIEFRMVRTSGGSMYDIKPNESFTLEFNFREYLYSKHSDNLPKEATGWHRVVWKLSNLGIETEFQYYYDHEKAIDIYLTPYINKTKKQ